MSSLTDSEIMGNIGFGNDPLAAISPMDMRAFLASSTAPTLITTNRRYDVRAADPSYPLNEKYTEPYYPLQQEPAGRSYSSMDNHTFYNYPAWNPDDLVSGISYEPRTRYPTQTFPPENALQTAMQFSGAQEDITRTIDTPDSINSYHADTFKRLGVVRKSMSDNDFGSGEALTRGIKEGFVGLRDSIVGNNSTIVFILIFILFIVIALQHQTIQRLHGMVEKFVDPRK